MNPSHGLSWEKSGEQEGVFATLFILTGKLLNITKVKVSFTKSSDGATVLIDGIKKGACIIAMRNVISNGTVATYITSALCDTDGVVKLYLNTNVSSVTTDVTIIWTN